MVLLFLRFSVSGDQIPLDIDINSRVSDVKQIISRTRNIAITKQRLIFGGRILKDDNVLTSYNIQKECSIQVFVTGAISRSAPGEDTKSDEEKQAPSEAGSPPPPLTTISDEEGKENYDWQGDKAGSPPTASLEFGDLVLVQLLEAQNLKKSNFWSRTMRPYVILAVGNNSSRSKVITSKSIAAPRWDEMFGFRMDTHGQSLNVLVFDHDDYRPDKFVGSAEINLGSLPRDSVSDVWLNLEHASSGRIHIQLRRSILASPSHHEILSCLMEMERSWTSQDLARLNITLHQLIGRQAWTTGDMCNPVIEHLIAAVCSGTIRWSNATLRRVESILMSQNMLPMRGLPSTHLYLSGLRLQHANQQSGFSKTEFMRMAREYVAPKYCYIAPSSGDHTFVLLSFKTIREALMALVVFQSRILPEHSGNPVMLSFGRNLPCRVHQIDTLQDIRMAGFLNVFGLDETGWNFCWVVLSSKIDPEIAKYRSTLSVHRSLSGSAEEPTRTIQLEDCIVAARGRSSLELHEPEKGRSTFLYCQSAAEFNDWTRLIRASSEGKELPAGPLTRVPSDHVCDTCNVTCRLDELYTCDKRDDAVCIDCLRREILDLIEEHDTKALTKLFTVQDLRELLTTEEFTKYLEISLEELVNNSEVFVKCPTCYTAWEFVSGSAARDAPDFGAERGIDGRELNENAQQHYLSNRLRCRNPTCDTVFCRSCKETPYHTGFDCPTYQVYKLAEHCRFCNCALMPDTKCLEPRSEALEDVCNNPLCMEKMEQSCTCVLECGHACGGVRDEEEHLICLHHGCRKRSGDKLQNPEDDCAICFSEQLGHAPALQLDCGHIFHYDCIKKRLDSKWPGPQVTFNFSTCPLCGVRMTHDILDNEVVQDDPPLPDVKRLYKLIEKQAWEKAKDENIFSDAAYKDPENEYYNNPCGYAQKKLAFYMCHRCKNPYYGGMARCAEAAHGFRESDFICPACSGIGQDTCAIHGKEFVQYKCRFCCSVSTYFCWGTTHFCESCHRRQEGHDYMTTKSADELPKCPGPEKCPLKVKHPANGEEYSLGCAMCRGGDVSSVQQVKDNDAPRSPGVR